MQGQKWVLLKQTDENQAALRTTRQKHEQNTEETIII